MNVLYCVKLVELPFNVRIYCFRLYNFEVLVLEYFYFEPLYTSAPQHFGSIYSIVLFITQNVFDNFI